jgi:hypothetical protein
MEDVLELRGRENHPSTTRMTPLGTGQRCGLTAGFRIIDDRAASKATIITSQLPIEHWHAWVGDATIADAMLDRIMQKNHRLTLAGDSLRQKPKTGKKEEKTNPS